MLRVARSACFSPEGRLRRRVSVRTLCAHSSRIKKHPYFAIHEEFEKDLASSDIFAPFSFISNILFASESESESELINFVGSRRVLKELQHPLLLKYKFDPLNFIAGTRLAHTRILECLYARDLRHYLDGHVSHGPSKSFLEEVCSPEALQSFLDHADNGYGGELVSDGVSTGFT